MISKVVALSSISADQHGNFKALPYLHLSPCLLVRNRFEFSRQAVSSVVDYYVDASELLQCGIEGLIHGTLIGDIEVDSQVVVICCAIETELGAVSRCCNDFVAFLQGFLDELLAEARAGSGDEEYLWCHDRKLLCGCRRGRELLLHFMLWL